MISHDASVRYLADHPVTNEPDRFLGLGEIECAFVFSLVPQRSPIAQDILHHITDESFVLFKLGREACELWIFLFLQNRFSLIHKLRPCAWRRKVVFFQKILAVIEKSGVNKNRHPKDLALVGVRLNGRFKKLLLLRPRKEAFQRESPAGGGEFCRPDDIHKKDINLRIAVFKLLRKQVMEFCGRMRTHLADNSYSWVLSLKISYGLIPNPLRIRSPRNKADLCLGVTGSAGKE